MQWINNGVKRQCLDLYKQFLFASKIYPGDGRVVMQKVRERYYSYADCTDEKVIRKAIKDGKWYLKEMEGTAKIAKYRFIKTRYESNDTNTTE